MQQICGQTIYIYFVDRGGKGGGKKSQNSATVIHGSPQITNQFLFNHTYFLPFPHLRLVVPTRTATQLIWRHRRRVWQSQQPAPPPPPLPLFL